MSTHEMECQLIFIQHLVFNVEIIFFLDVYQVIFFPALFGMGFTADHIVYHELVMTSKEYMQVKENVHVLALWFEIEINVRKCITKFIC